jgi:arabinofuranosyltransferase
MLLGTAWMGDDAFITLRVVDNFVNGNGLRFNVLERVQAFTHPLWMFCLTPFYAVTREPFFTAMLLSVVVSLSALWVLATRIASSLELGALLILACLASTALCDFSTSGLETPLTFLLIALFVWQSGKGSIIGAPIIAGLLFLNRLDLIVLFAPALAHFFLQAKGKRRLHVIGASLAPAASWMLFSLAYYGAPFPNTAYAKLGTGLDTGVLIMRGLQYTQDFILADPLLALLIVAAVFLALRSKQWLVKSLGLGMILYLAYILKIGGDFMSGRFFAPPGFLALCLLAREPMPPLFAKWWRKIGFAGIAALAVLLGLRMTEEPLSSLAIPADGIIEERLFYYSGTGLVPVLKSRIETGDVPLTQWVQRGRELRDIAARQGAPIVVASGTIGMRGYFGGPQVHLIDELALTDAFLARLPAIPNSRVGHYRRLLPEGYAESSITNRPATSVAPLQPLLDDVTLVTRAPLFAEGRWDAIWRLLSGHYRWVYDKRVN